MRYLRLTRRSDQGGLAEGFAGGKLLSRWREQRYLGADRRIAIMLSRVASSLYWMNRYIERAENTARFVDVNLRLLLDLPGGSAEQWQSLIDGLVRYHLHLLQADGGGLSS